MLHFKLLALSENLTDQVYFCKISNKKPSIISPSFQQLEHLKNDNQRLRDENGALIRVISKLSK